MKRVIVSSSKFRCSAPGYDADTAAEANIAFDAFSPAPYNGTYLLGFLNANAFIDDGSGIGFYKDVSFGKTFSAAPQGLVLFGKSNGDGVFVDFYRAGQQSDGNFVFVEKNVTQTYMRLYYHRKGGGYTAPLPAIYLVMQV